MGEFARPRVALSNLGLAVSRLICKLDLSDPMSGYFALTRTFLEQVVHNTTGVGFKILLDLVASSRKPVRFTEVPYVFRRRQHGESKLDVNVGLEYIYLVVDKLIGRWLPVRFVLFCLVGLGGMALHLGIVWLMFRRLGASFGTALLTAISIAMITNFLVNNAFTYRDRRRRGWGVLSGLALFVAACAVGNMANYVLTRFLVSEGVWWPVAGLCGIGVGSVWNYGASSVLTWRPRVGRFATAAAKGALRCSVL
jgi:dolichol-phosphate mannosyltransferase